MAAVVAVKEATPTCSWGVSKRPRSKLGCFRRRRSDVGGGGGGDDGGGGGDYGGGQPVRLGFHLNEQSEGVEG